MTRRAVLVCAFVAGIGGAGCGGSAPAPASAATAAPAKPDLSTAEGVIEASIAAQGGRDKLGKVTSLVMSGTLTIKAANVKGAVHVFAAPPRELLQKVELAGLGDILAGTHGDLAWEKSSMQGARILTGVEKSTALRENTFNGDLQWKQLYAKAELAGVVDYAGTKAYKIVLTASDGDSVTHYIATDTLLPVGTEKIATSQMGKIAVKSVESDFRDVGGLKFPFKLVQTDEVSGGFEIVFDSIKQNEPIPPGTFDPPEDVQKLVK